MLELCIYLAFGTLARVVESCLLFSFSITQGKGAKEPNVYALCGWLACRHERRGYRALRGCLAWRHGMTRLGGAVSGQLSPGIHCRSDLLSGPVSDVPAGGPGCVPAAGCCVCTPLCTPWPRAGLLGARRGTVGRSCFVFFGVFAVYILCAHSRCVPSPPLITLALSGTLCRALPHRAELRLGVTFPTVVLT